MYPVRCLRQERTGGAEENFERKTAFSQLSVFIFFLL